MVKLRIWQISWLLSVIALLPGGASGQVDESPHDGADSAVSRKAIDAGYVMLDGRYLPPPYTLERREDDLWVNGKFAISGWFDRQKRGFSGRFGSGWAGGRRAMRGPGGGFGAGAPRPRDGNGDGQDPVEPEDGRPPEDQPEAGARPAAAPFNGGPGGDGPRGGGRWGGGPAGWRNWGWSENARFAVAEKTLQDNGLLLGGENISGCALFHPEALYLLHFLRCDDPVDDKVLEIKNEFGRRMEESDWREVVVSFVADEAWSERMGEGLEEIQRIEDANSAAHNSFLASAFWDSRPVKYSVTLVAMGLVVAACGTLLNHRPQGRARWSEVDAAGDGVTLVVRSVVLLVLLGLFDLGCTLVAYQSGGFTEMNPLGSRLIENPVTLICFKLTTLLVACGILFALRRYRGAQVAAWWMCLLCTVLTFRWLTFNSMFM